MNKSFILVCLLISIVSSALIPGGSGANDNLLGDWKYDGDLSTNILYDVVHLDRMYKNLGGSITVNLYTYQLDQIVDLSVKYGNFSMPACSMCDFHFTTLSQADRVHSFTYGSYKWLVFSNSLDEVIYVMIP